MASGWVSGREREADSGHSLQSLLERERLSLPSSGLRDAVGPQTGTSLLFKSTCFTRYNMEEPGRQDAE